MKKMSHDSRATIYDVAKHAGVSIGSVSRVLNDYSDVTEEMRAKVMRSVQELGYLPDETARALGRRKRG